MRTSILAAADLDELIQSLKAAGYQVIGPVRDDAAVVYDDINSATDLPRGWVDEQEKGHYRLLPAGDDRYFGYTVAANAWKRFLNPPRKRLWRVVRQDGKLQFIPESDSAPPLAFIGVRSCELHAIHIQDRVLIDGAHCDEGYRQRRRHLFTVAVNCTRAAATCFCTSMHTGPRVELQSDLVLTELLDEHGHRFLLETGTDAGHRITASLPLMPATDDDTALAESRINIAREQMLAGPRQFDSSGIHNLLFSNMESPAWDAVAERCLSCANCTLACPTCFCFAVEDTTDLTGDHAERWQRWDSCFNGAFSHVHGGSVRNSTRARYRQWMTHKLAGWVDQFGQSGCVGCGRCISWCPAGIDITEQLQAIAEGDAS
ncbi:MAG: 4Fe-4S dicluster domain-containing protein [Gammaproteobacteria bacterium]|nr:4Fe-4S dicluster domain-containing protein [Gammaproteobacteria bacterium]